MIKFSAYALHLLVLLLHNQERLLSIWSLNAVDSSSLAEAAFASNALTVTEPDTVAGTASCGVIYFYHVGKTGGTGIWDMIIKLVNENYNMFGKRRSKSKPSAQTVWANLVQQVEAVPQKAEKAENGTYWLGVQSHSLMPGLVWQFPRLLKLKESLTSKSQCRFLMVTVVREPESHFWSHYFYGQQIKGIVIPSSDLHRKGGKQKFVMEYAATHYEMQIQLLLWCKFFMPANQNPDSGVYLPKVNHNAMVFQDLSKCPLFLYCIM